MNKVKHSDMMAKDLAKGECEAHYTCESHFVCPWDLEKVDDTAGCDWWIKWDRLYVNIHGERYEYGPMYSGPDNPETKHPSHVEITDYPMHYKDVDCVDMCPCGDGEGEIQYSEYDLDPRCPHCHREHLKDVEFGGFEKRLAAEKIQNWALKCILSPHTKIGKKMIMKKAEQFFESEEEMEEDEDTKKQCESCGTDDKVYDYWWVEQAGKKWQLCEQCGIDEEQEKCVEPYCYESSDHCFCSVGGCVPPSGEEEKDVCVGCEKEVVVDYETGKGYTIANCDTCDKMLCRDCLESGTEDMCKYCVVCEDEPERNMCCGCGKYNDTRPQCDCGCSHRSNCEDCEEKEEQEKDECVEYERQCEKEEGCPYHSYIWCGKESEFYGRDYICDKCKRDEKKRREAEYALFTPPGTAHEVYMAKHKSVCMGCLERRPLQEIREDIWYCEECSNPQRDRKALQDALDEYLANLNIN